jgi:hypothetical protein
MKKTFLIICTLFSLISYSQKEYKVGVNLFRRVNPGTTKQYEITGATLDSIVAALTANNPQRQSGTGTSLKKIQLVVQLDVPWYETAFYDLQGNLINYDFNWYKNFATLCEARNIKWTPLLAPHYVPQNILNKYPNDILKNIDGTAVSSPFLPFSPSSSVWNNEVASWIRAFVIAMRGSDFAINSVDKNHFSIPTSIKSIDEILVGNEMMYPFNKATSGDNVTKAKWLTITPILPTYPSTESEFLAFWNNQVNLTTNVLRNFRNQQLAYCISGMIYTAKDQLSLSTMLGATNANNIGISSKLFSYFFPRTTSSITDEISGYDNAQLGYIINQSSKFLAVDSYSSPSFTIIDDFVAANSRVSQANTANPTNPKRIYISEFNKNIGLAGNNTPLTATEIFNNGNTGFNSHNVGYYVFFAWNPTYNPAEPFYKITQGQQLGLYNLFNTIGSQVLVGSTATNIINPIEPGLANNFVSGAFSIANNYNNSTSHSIYSGDVDWFKFTTGTGTSLKTFYLKVVQQSNIDTTPTVAKTYGLQLVIDACGVLTQELINQPVVLK